MTIDEVVPWGRSLDEYIRMFALSDDDLAGRILGCGDGPASFNAELTARGGHVVSVDPIYAFEADDIRRRIDEVTPEVLQLARANRDTFVWESIRSVDHLHELRRRAMDRFLSDYTSGRASGRYVAESLPGLSFADGTFDLALCSHMLFTYSHVLDESFHVDAIAEMCRAAREVRVFPLLDMTGERSVHVDPVSKRLAALGLGARIDAVDCEFQRGGNEMMVVTRSRGE